MLPFMWNPDGIQVEVVAPCLDEKQHVLPGTGEAILDALGQVYGFVPDDIVSQNPSALDQSQGQARRNESQGLVTHDIGADIRTFAA